MSDSWLIYWQLLAVGSEVYMINLFVLRITVLGIEFKCGGAMKYGYMLSFPVFLPLGRRAKD